MVQVLCFSWLTIVDAKLVRGALSRRNGEEQAISSVRERGFPNFQVITDELVHGYVLGPDPHGVDVRLDNNRRSNMT